MEFIKRSYSIKCPLIKTIYNWINSKIWKINRKNLLRSNYVFGGKRQKSVQERLVRKRWVRPFKIGLRKEFGHWEANLIKGKRATKVHLLVFQERLTRFVLIKKIMTKNPWNINLELLNLVKGYWI
ncbi:hypothetical protein DEH79_00205 [Mycoplasmopsis synoviae]|nr:hypothetical protein MSH_00210 [Mycoplasmopsis synoviae]QLE13607.1 hypothetical protein DEH79_00205 [Mycoplasmopsis synoviae]